jgi:hypothetical protein
MTLLFSPQADCIRFSSCRFHFLRCLLSPLSIFRQLSTLYYFASQPYAAFAVAYAFLARALRAAALRCEPMPLRSCFTPSFERRRTPFSAALRRLRCHATPLLLSLLSPESFLYCRRRFRLRRLSILPLSTLRLPISAHFRLRLRHAFTPMPLFITTRHAAFCHAYVFASAKAPIDTSSAAMLSPRLFRLAAELFFHASY